MQDNGPMHFEGGAREAPLSETQELELASELLEVASEAELEQFLGHVFHRVGNALGAVMHSDTAQALGGILKDAAARALPVVGRAIEERVIPNRGGNAGGQLAEAAGAMLGLELEGLSPQDQEFEAARQFVRLAGAAAQQAILAPPTLPPQQAARHALATAGDRFAPGLAQEVWRGSRRPVRRGAGTRSFSGPRGFSSPRYPRSRASGRRYAQPRAAGPPGQRLRAGAYWRRPIGSGARPSGARYGTPYGARYGPDWRRSWQPGARSYRYGFGPARTTVGDGSWFYRDQGWRDQQYRDAPAQAPVEGAIDWSRRLYFFGASPPPAPPGAPGRWVYGGRHRGRRRWVWSPIPGAPQFLWATPAAYAAASPGTYPAGAPEPEPPARGPDDASAMPGLPFEPQVEPPPFADGSAPPTNGASQANGAAGMGGMAQPDGSGPPMTPAVADQGAQNGAVAPQGM